MLRFVRANARRVLMSIIGQRGAGKRAGYIEGHLPLRHLMGRRTLRRAGSGGMMRARRPSPGGSPGASAGLTLKEGCT